MIALIPARAASKRCPGKNTRPLGASPLIAYSIVSAIDSGVFERVWVCSDDGHARDVVGQYGAEFYLRPPVSDGQPDIEWVSEVLSEYEADFGRAKTFAILRPTSPFRTADTIRRAFKEFTKCDGTHDSLRAVEPVTQTPYKMWTWEGQGYPIKPLLDAKNEDGVPYHSMPTQAAPQTWIQNSSLEMAWTANVEVFHSIAGRKVIPFFTEGHEGFAIDTEADWREAERLVASGEAHLPPVSVAAVSATPQD